MLFRATRSFDIRWLSGADSNRFLNDSTGRIFKLNFIAARRKRSAWARVAIKFTPVDIHIVPLFRASNLYGAWLHPSRF